MTKYKLVLIAFVFLFGFFISNINITNAQTTVSGCEPGYKFSVTTGQPCSTTSATNSGCIPGAKFSSTTGEPCSGAGGTTVSSNTIVTDRIIIVGMRGNDVRLIQQFLKDEGYLTGRVDGVYGPISARAVRYFQEDYGLSVTGRVDAITLNKINSILIGSPDFCLGDGGACPPSPIPPIPNPPVISGVSGPQTLNVNQQGTWTVKASSANGLENLSYKVIWGDEKLYDTKPSALGVASGNQTATFSHVYSKEGIYTIEFYVMSSNGQSAKASLTVKVGSVQEVGELIVSPNPISLSIGSRVVVTAEEKYVCNPSLSGVCPALYSIGVPAKWSVANTSIAQLQYTTPRCVVGYPCPEPTTEIVGVAAGTTTLTASYVNNSGKTMTKSVSVTVYNDVPNLSITTSSDLPKGRIGQSYSATINATGGADSASYSWKLVSGSLPPGITEGPFMACATLVGHGCKVPTHISGTPTTAGTYTFTYRLTAGAQSIDKTFTLVVDKMEMTAGTLMIEPSSLTMDLNQIIRVKAMYMPGCPISSDISCRPAFTEVDAQWSIANTSIASLMIAVPYCISSVCPPSMAEVVALSAGTTTLTATYTDSQGKKLTSNASIIVNGPDSPTTSNIIGYADTISCSIIGGWALNMNNTNAQTVIRIYDEVGGTRSMISRIETNGLRSDVNTAYGVTGNHGFTINTPSSVKDGRSHKISVYAVNENQFEKLLSGSPQTVSCPTSLASASTGLTASAGSALSGSTATQTNSTSLLKHRFTRELSQGSQGNEVVELQKFLNTAGYSVGVADGKFGPKVKAAVMKFQETKGLKVDGLVGPGTLAELNK